MKQTRRVLRVLAAALAAGLVLTFGAAAAQVQGPDRFPYGGVLKASDLREYRVSDFINGDTAAGSLDARAWLRPQQLSSSNWFAAPSLTHYLLQLRKLSYQNQIAVERAESSIWEDIPIDESNPNAGGGGGDEEDYSTTNVQVIGVDEADIIKTDGKYIYYMGWSSVAVVRAGRTPVQVATLKPTSDNSAFQCTDMYLSGNKLVVISTEYWSEVTRFTIYDTSSPESPSLDRTVEVQGFMHATRLLNNQIYFVTRYTLPTVNYSSSIADLLPYYRDSVLGEDTCLVSPTSIHLLTQKNAYSSNQYTMVGFFSLTDENPVACSAYEGRTDAVYMNRDALYLANIYGYGYPRRTDFIKTDYDLSFRTLGNDSPHSDTYLHRFAVTPTGLRYAGMGIVPGTLINQYAMDEHQGSLRVATNKGGGNGVYVLSTGDMSTSGSLGGLAPGESIKSVRFSGTTGYVVTFLETDPLFVINLENPAKPTLMGELKIPGFSTYLHPIGDGLVIGVGRAGTDEIAQALGREESWTGTAGMKLSMFDVSDPRSPTEVSKLVIGDESTYSEAIYNPKAIMFDPGKKIMTFPVSYTQEDYTQWAGGMVFGYGADGFQRKSAFSMGDYYGRDSRFAYIGDILYYASDSGLMSIDYQSYQPIGQIKLEF